MIEFNIERDLRELVNMLATDMFWTKSLKAGSLPPSGVSERRFKMKALAASIEKKAHLPAGERMDLSYEQISKWIRANGEDYQTVLADNIDKHLPELKRIETAIEQTNASGHALQDIYRQKPLADDKVFQGVVRRLKNGFYG